MADISLIRTLSGRSHCMAPKVSISARELTVITNWSKNDAKLFIQSILYTRRFYITCITKKKNWTVRNLSERFVWKEEKTKFKIYVLTLPVGQDKLYLTWVRMADPFWNRSAYIPVMILCTIVCRRRSHLIKIFSRDALNTGKTVKARF